MEALRMASHLFCVGVIHQGDRDYLNSALPFISCSHCERKAIFFSTKDSRVWMDRGADFLGMAQVCRPRGALRGRSLKFRKEHFDQRTGRHSGHRENIFAF